jgi:hypothetical protein
LASPEPNTAVPEKLPITKNDPLDMGDILRALALVSIVFFGVWGTDSGDMWAVGKAGTILHKLGSTDTWNDTFGGECVGLKSIWGTVDQTGTEIWIVGKNGTILFQQR